MIEIWSHIGFGKFFKSFSIFPNFHIFLEKCQFWRSLTENCRPGNILVSMKHVYMISDSLYLLCRTEIKSIFFFGFGDIKELIEHPNVSKKWLKIGRNLRDEDVTCALFSILDQDSFLFLKIFFTIIIGAFTGLTFSSLSTVT